MTEALLQSLPIDQLQASTTNPRRHFDRPALDELKASIAASGIQVPLLVRRVEVETEKRPGFKFCYEIVAGERRFRAAQELKLTELPCLVRELTDAEARECQIIENLQRADVPPVEEAEAFGELLGRLGSIAAVAAKLGKAQPYVAKSLRLLKLTLHSRDALRGGLITIDHALLLARLAETEQNAALKWCLDRNAGSKTGVDKVVAERLALIAKKGGSKEFYGWTWEPESIVKLKSHIEGESGIKLSRAPWDLNSTTMHPEAPDCNHCPNNTKANAPLFGDMDMGDATCTDGACFQVKTDTFVHIELSKAGYDPKAKPAKLVPRLSWKYSGVKPSIVQNDIKTIIDSLGRCAETANPAKLLKKGQWAEAKKGSCPNVRPGITADWSDSGDRGYMGSREKLRKPGEALLVCIAVGCKVHPKGYEKRERPAEAANTQKNAAEIERREKLRDLIEDIEPKIRQVVFTSVVHSLAADPAKALRLLADEDQRAPARRKKLLELFPKLNGEQLEMLTVFVCEFEYSATDCNEYYMVQQQDGIAADRARLWKLAKVAGVDADAVTRKYFEDAGGVPAGAEPLCPAAKAAPAKKVAAKAVAKKAPSKKNVGALKKRIAKAAKKSVTAKRSKAARSAGAKS